MGCLAEGRRWSRVALGAALLLSVSGCAVVQNQSSASPSPFESPSPSPSPAALAITAASFHAGEVGVAYAPVTPGASGGAAPYTWTLSAGALPRGLTLGPGGTVSGRPSHAGTFHFTLQVADSAGVKVTVARSVAIAPFLQLSLISACAGHCSVEVGCVSVCGRFGTATGGLPPYRYALAGGYVPTGTSLSGLSLAGTFGGSPSRWQFTVAVTDALGVTKTITTTFFTYAHISLLSGACSSLGASCNTILGYLGGLPGTVPTARVTANPLSYGYAAAITITVQSGRLLITVGPQPNLLPYSGTLTLVLTDQSVCGPGVRCSSAWASLTVSLGGG